MERWEAKLISLFGMFVIIFISMALPIKASALIQRQGNSAGRILALLRCFAGGVFLGTILLHMVPEVHDQIQESLLEPKGIDYPIAELLIALGFFFICVFERVVLMIHNQSKKKGSKVDNVALTSQVMVQAHLEQVGDTPCALNEVMEERETTSHTNHAFKTDANQNLNNSHDNGVVSTTTNPSIEQKVPPMDELGAEDDIAQTRSLILVLALSFECIFDGLSVGLQLTETGVWNMFIAIVSHEFIIAFCLGIELTKFHSNTKVLLAAFAYAMIPPIGCAVGMIITETDLEIDENTLETASGLLIALAAGIFLYCTFIGMLGEELIEHCTFEKILVTAVGCAVMAALAALPEDDETIDDDIIATTTSMLNQ